MPFLLQISSNITIVVACPEKKSSEFFFEITSTSYHPIQSNPTSKRQFATMMLSYENRPAAMSNPTPVTSDHLPISSSQAANKNGNLSNTGRQIDTKHHHIWLITGPAGCGKSTVAQFIAKSMNLPFIEGDEVFSHFLLHLPFRIPNSTLRT